jgi:hypothetical protein
MAHDVVAAAKPKADPAKPVRPELPRGDVIDERRILAAYKQMLVALFVSTLIVTGVLIALLLPFSFLFNADRNPPLIFVVILAGALGAFFSALIRLYNFDDLPKALVARGLEGLPKGHLRIYSLVPAVIGAISATVLYLVFAADMLQGGLFPKFGCELGENKCDLFRTLLNQWHPAQASDYAKTLVWSFIAGFAERLVPDTLQGLTRAAQPNKHDQTPTSPN